jgi:hypothetical protein
MSVSLDVHHVARVEVSAYSRKVSGADWRAHWQKLELFDSENNPIGEVTLFLDQPIAALAIGDCSQLDGFTSALPLLPPPAPALHLTNQVSGF